MNKLYEKRRLRPPVNSAGWERALEEGPAGRLPQNGSQEAWGSCHDPGFVAARVFVELYPLRHIVSVLEFFQSIFC